MKAIFADTSFFVALLVPHDRFHSQATSLMLTLQSRLITTDWVLVELANFMSRSKSRTRVPHFVRDLQTDVRFDFVPATAAAIEEGLLYYGQHADKHWSLTDCISFLIMRREGIQEALSTDHHFEQAGFRILLVSNP